MIAASLTLLAGLALIAWAADQLVVGAARLALSLRVSAVVVGATVIGLGTSAPEILISGLAAAEGSVEIAAGNIVGSNIANVTLVAAVAALVAPLSVASKTLRREAPLSALAVIAFALALQAGLSRAAGVALLLALPLVLAWIVRSRRRGDDSVNVESEQASGVGMGLRGEATRTLLALLGTAAGAQLIVMGAEGIASETGVRDGFIGLTLVAIGTSMPEMVTAVQAARRGQHDLVVGNVLGSNIFNSLAAGGLIALIAPGALADPDLTGLAAIAMVAAALVTTVFLVTDRRISRWEAALLVGTYVGLLPLLSR